MADDGLDLAGSLADPVRRTLYRFVAEATGPVGKDDAAAHAGIGRSLAAYHLDRLVADGLLRVSYARRSGKQGPGAGRPAKLYAPTDLEVRVQLPARDDALLARLLAAAIEADESRRTVAALARVAREEGERAGRAVEAPDERAISEMLAARGYAPCAGDDGIRMRNCPFHHLVDEHRDLVCNLNLALLDAAVRTADAPLRAELAPSAEHCCVVLRRT
jgi:predicted ArsR family transcriptional regulator